MDRLFPLVYEELHRIAHCALRGERTGHTLGTTGLVHEAYLRMADQTRLQYHDRAHFYGVAARTMRRILVDYARRHRAAKWGGAKLGEARTFRTNRNPERSCRADPILCA